MLVITRRTNEKIIFPNIGVTVQLLESRGSCAKIGIEAPPEIKVLREELASRTPEGQASQVPLKSEAQALRNQLDKISLSLHLLQKHLQAGRVQESRQILDKILSFLDNLDQGHATRGKTQRPENQPFKHRIRSLLVEDDHNERALLAGLLAMHGCECHTAADGLEALDYLSSHERPDVVLLDMVMPRCDGVQTLAQIRDNPKYQGLKIYAISGSAQESLKVQTGPGGVDAWFQKPLNPNKLWEAIQNHMKSPGQAN